MARMLTFPSRWLFGRIIRHSNLLLAPLDVADVRAAWGWTTVVLEYKPVVPMDCNPTTWTSLLCWAGLSVARGSLASLRVTVPWRGLLTDSCRVELDGLHLRVEDCAPVVVPPRARPTAPLSVPRVGGGDPLDGAPEEGVIPEPEDNHDEGAAVCLNVLARIIWQASWLLTGMRVARAAKPELEMESSLGLDRGQWSLAARVRMVGAAEGEVYGELHPGKDGGIIPWIKLLCSAVRGRSTG
jgi:hypothetical protein